MPPGPRPTSVQSGILIHPTIWPQYTNVTDRQTDRQTGQRSRSIGRDVTCNGRPKKSLVYVCTPAIWTTVMQMESTQKTLSHSASSKSLYLGRRKPLPISQNYFRSRDNHFRFDGNRKYCRLNSQVNNPKASGRQKSTPGDLRHRIYSLPVKPEVVFRSSADAP